ncbi:MAG: hypothetical protein JW828_14410, partial [Sedimentisphaerales bacterium]|nr:hypothetical protein [Sedimentisphaerales bacterium]
EEFGLGASVDFQNAIDDFALAHILAPSECQLPIFHTDMLSDSGAAFLERRFLPRIIFPSLTYKMQEKP